MFKTLNYQIFKFNHSPYISQMLAILSNNEKSVPWKMSNFLHMRINQINSLDYFYTDLPWIKCPFLDFYDIPTIFVKNHFISFLDFVREALDLDCYILFGINMSEIPEYEVKGNLCHNPMIIGIDDEKEIVFMADFFNGVYKVIKVPFKTIKKAFDNLSLCIEFKNETQFNMGKISLFKVVENVDYKFDMLQFKKQLVYFLSSSNLFKEENISVSNIDLNSFVFGLQCYDYAINTKYTMRILSLFLLRSYIWKQRLNFFNVNNILVIDEEILICSDELIILSKACLYIYIYYNKTFKDKSKLIKIENKLLECKQLETKIINYILKST